MPLLREIVRLSPEQDLLLQSLRARLLDSDSSPAPISPSQATETVNWDAFWHEVQQHDVHPMAMYAIQQGYLSNVPAHYQQHFPAIHQTTIIRNASLTRTLLLVLQQLEAEGIDVIPFKGPTLALRVYGNLTQRRFCDLDLLVDQTDFERTKNWFLQQGYELNIDGESSVHLIHPQTDVNIDLHHQISDQYFPFQLDYSALLQRSEKYQYANQSIRVLSFEDTLILLCIQLAKDAHHQQKFLKKACDLAVLINQTHFSWEDAIAYADSMNGKRLVLFSLYLANQLLAVELPDWITQSIEADRILVIYGQSVCQRLFTEDTFQRGNRGMLLRALFLLEKPFEFNDNTKDIFQHILTATAAKFRLTKK